MAETATKLPINVEKSKSDRPSEWRPFETLRHQIDRVFDDFQRGAWGWTSGHTAFDAEPFWRGELSWGKTPAVDVTEKDTGYEITAEPPGMEEKNIDVKFADGVLTIKGEKNEEKEEKKKDYVLSERRYGSFQRSFQLPDGVDAEKIEATFKGGVLTVSLPKTADARKSEKKIAVKAA